MIEIKEFTQYLETEREACLQSANALNGDSRADEANLAKVRANIYGIVESVCRVSEKQAPSNPAAFIREKIESIPQAWAESHHAAERHGDHEKAAIEQLKMETMAQIDRVFSRMVERKQ